MGGFTTGKKEVIELLAPAFEAILILELFSAMQSLEGQLQYWTLLKETTAFRDKLMDNVAYFKAGVKAAGFDFKDGESAIVPIMLYDAKALSRFSPTNYLEEGIYVIGFFYPVVPKEQARIRVQLSAAS